MLRATGHAPMVNQSPSGSVFARDHQSAEVATNDQVPASADFLSRAQRAFAGLRGSFLRFPPIGGIVLTTKPGAQATCVSTWLGELWAFYRRQTYFAFWSQRETTPC